MLFLLADDSTPDAGDPPTGAPTSLSGQTYGASRLRLLWTNADVTAYTKIYREFGTCPQTSPTVIGTVNPGITSFDSNIEVIRPIAEFDISFVVRHYKNGQLSDPSNCYADDAETVPG